QTKDSTPLYARRLLRCWISVWPVTASGQQRRSRSGLVGSPCPVFPKSGRKWCAQRTAALCQERTFGGISDRARKTGPRPPDRDIPFWVGCAAVVEPKRHMRIDRLILCEPRKFETQKA